MQNLGERTLDWAGDQLWMVDQTRLPDAYEVLQIGNVAELVGAIRRLTVRGAPAIGVAGGFGVVLAAREHGADRAVRGRRGLHPHRAPAAVNLARMVDRVAARSGEGIDALLAEALAIRDEEVDASVSMSGSAQHSSRILLRTPALSPP